MEESGSVSIEPLRKRTRDGKLYSRDPNVEDELGELSLLPQEELLTRCAIHCRKNPGYVSSECLVYFVRACRSDNSEVHFERLYRILAERVLACLPKAENYDGKTLSLTKIRVREHVFDRFFELLAEDRQTYSEKLDYFEVRFNGALASLRRDAQEQAWREENRTTTLEFDEETGELAPEVERAAGSFNPFDPAEIADRDYRSRLEAAIDTLPPQQRRIIEMMRQGIPIDSKEPGIVTIARTLGKSEKTIRTHRDKAYTALRDIVILEEAS